MVMLLSMVFGLAYTYTYTLSSSLQIQLILLTFHSERVHFRRFVPYRDRTFELHFCNQKTSGLYGSTVKGLVNVVCQLIVEHLNSYQGFDDTGDDGALHVLSRMIHSGKEK